MPVAPAAFVCMDGRNVSTSPPAAWSPGDRAPLRGEEAATSVRPGRGRRRRLRTAPDLESLGTRRLLVGVRAPHPLPFSLCVSPLPWAAIRRQKRSASAESETRERRAPPTRPRAHTRPETRSAIESCTNVACSSGRLSFGDRRCRLGHWVASRSAPPAGDQERDAPATGVATLSERATD